VLGTAQSPIWEHPFALIAIDIAEGSSKLGSGDGSSAILETRMRSFA
jgi:hypothetical protein